MRPLYPTDGPRVPGMPTARRYRAGGYTILYACYSTIRRAYRSIVVLARAVRLSFFLALGHSTTRLDPVAILATSSSHASITRMVPLLAPTSCFLLAVAATMLDRLHPGGVFPTPLRGDSGVYHEPRCG